MKNITNHLGEIIVSLAAIVLIISVVTFTSPGLTGFFSEMTDTIMLKASDMLNGIGTPNAGTSGGGNGGGAGGSNPAPADPLNPSGVIPEGATYIHYTNSRISDNDGWYLWEYDEEITYHAGDNFPLIINKGDIYQYGDYEYCYGYSYYVDEWTETASWEHQNDTHINDDLNGKIIEIDGWGVRYIKDDTTPGVILDTIANKPILSLVFTFTNWDYYACCFFNNIEIAPTLPKYVTNLYYTFAFADNLKTYAGSTDPDGDFSNYIIPSNVTDMSDTFYDCSSLTNAPTIPNSVENMSNTFYGCSMLCGDVVIDANPISYKYCFAGTKLIIGLVGSSTLLEELAATDSSMPTSSEYAFGWWDNVRVGNADDYKPGTFILLENDYAVLLGEDCYALKRYENFTITTRNGAPWYKDSNYKNIKNVIIKDDVTIIPYYAFSGCAYFESLTIPKSVSCIESNAFEDCIALKSVIFEDGIVLERIESSTFYGCENLEQIVLPNTVTYIGGNAFKYCAFEAINIPQGVTFIGNDAFATCKNLTSIVLPHGLTSIEQYTFSSCYNLTHIVIPVTVTTLRSNAFENCENLTNVTYAGIKEQWVNTGYFLDTNHTHMMDDSYTVHCTDGDIVYIEGVMQ